MKTNYLLIGILVMAACTSNTKKNNMEKEMIKNDSLVKKQVYQTLVNFNQVFKDCGKQIFYTKSMGYEWYFIKDGGLTSDEIADSIRIPILNNAIENPDFKNLISKRFKIKIDNFKNSIEDPVSLGYLLLQNNVGSDLLDIITKRMNLNGFYEFYQDDDPSMDMSKQDYIKYHTSRIYLINDSVVIYKNTDKELCLGDFYHVIYFRLVKDFTSDKWLLDDVTVCKKEEEEQYDNKLIGQPQPLKYYEAKAYDYEE